MYVITVEFTIHQDQIAAFMPLMLDNARTSRESEPGCRRFDVCVDPEKPECIFLYELYDDRAAFDAHLASAHFRAIDGVAKTMVASKLLHAYELVGA